jgi:hypothetical protein
MVVEEKDSVRPQRHQPDRQDQQGRQDQNTKDALSGFTAIASARAKISARFRAKILNMDAPDDTLLFDQRTSIFCMLRLPRYCGKVWGVRMRPHSCILTYWYSRSPRRALQFVQCFKQPASQASIVKNGFPENRRASHFYVPFAGPRPLVPETNLCQPGTGTLPV